MRGLTVLLTATSGLTSVRECYDDENREMFNLVINACSAAEANLALNLLVDDVPEKVLVSAINLREVLQELPVSPFSMRVDEQTFCRTLGYEKRIACFSRDIGDDLELSITTAGNLVLDIIVRYRAHKYFWATRPRLDDFIAPKLLPLIIENDYLLDEVIELTRGMGLVFNPKFYLSLEDWRLEYAQDAMEGLGELF